MMMTDTKKHTKEKILLVNELHKPIRKNFKRRRTIIRGIDELWQSDLAQMDMYASSNNNFKYILVVIDSFSKYVWVKPLKTKLAVEVTDAFKAILSCGRTPVHLQTDQGKEFFNVHFNNLMKLYGVNHYNTYSCKKAAIAERVIRTIKERLFKYFSLNGTYRWIDILSEIIKNYNHTKHSTINMKPCDVNKDNESKVMVAAYNFIKIATGERKFKVGDIVRISKYKHIFEKGYTPNWTTELFKVAKVKITNPITYILEDMDGRPISGAFYTEELQKTAQHDVYLVEKVLRRRKDKVYVKWLGFDSTHNSWISLENKL